ncbi:hypothetical protein DHEL01_v202880 [Diaporthe helianthi]|uniref:Uncharacterized protein n=1 Tax=Diaporthe helianthi TaxID=158607 RepID=A0A2P5I889_DIAHE|nr:hypothetical protein DHEL01_v202880 [Diaporthe helianthi]
MFGSRLGPASEVQVDRTPSGPGSLTAGETAGVLAARFAGRHAAEAGRRDTAGGTWHVEGTSNTDGDGGARKRRKGSGH